MKKFRDICYLLLTLAILPVFSGCNDEDDVIKIFTGKTWKLSFIAVEGNTKWYNFWGDDPGGKAFQNSMAALKEESNFILNFEGTDLNGVIGGTFNGRASTATISGKWNANAETRALSTSDVKTAGTEVDKFIGKAFLDGLKNVKSYQGDDKNLYIYYKSGQQTFFLAFTPKR